ncbi:putative thioesterase [Burkholderia lata]|uniref:thioesterase n=1 Tax=Burkholderia lata (strain ATCC 17760 / DSM 23089 / LMG 22485 / NCIMB 9086 / R18194 / 383) TaxID=482957 RepID=UPI0014549F50|nr:thioesterase [Burkholderia lata]VWB70026.1 putative thioesterase [Burkholderia lata]
MNAPAPIEHLIGERPPTVRRRMKWNGCEPACVVDAATFADFVICAGELLSGALLGGTPQCAQRALGFGTPSRALSFDCIGALRPDDEFDMTTRVADVRNRSYMLDIASRTPQGPTAVNARLHRTPHNRMRRARRAQLDRYPARFPPGVARPPVRLYRRHFE